jgi:hypothetical protein
LLSRTKNAKGSSEGRNGAGKLQKQSTRNKNRHLAAFRKPREAKIETDDALIVASCRNSARAATVRC